MKYSVKCAKPQTIGVCEEVEVEVSPEIWEDGTYAVLSVVDAWGESKSARLAAGHIRKVIAALESFLEASGDLPPGEPSWHDIDWDAQSAVDGIRRNRNGK